MLLDGVHVARYSTCCSVEYMLLGGVHVARWSTCCSMEYMLLDGVHVARWSTCCSVEYMFLDGALVARRSTCSSVEEDTMREISCHRFMFTEECEMEFRSDPVGSEVSSCVHVVSPACIVN